MNKFITLNFIFLTLLLSCSWETEHPQSKVGKTENDVVFAWFPKQCPNGRTYWLEKIPIVRTYTVPTIFSGVVAFEHCTIGE